MKDPVTDFEYPAEWVAACRSPALLPDVRRGLAVLTSSGTVLRRGFTTGTTAAAACKAAVLSLAEDEEVTGVGITLPCGIAVRIPVDAYRGTASCWKDAGLPSDVTAGLGIVATAALDLGVGPVRSRRGYRVLPVNTHRHRRGRRRSVNRHLTVSGGRSRRGRRLTSRV